VRHHVVPAIGAEERTVHDQFDVSLEDRDLLVEVELTTNLIIAASEAEEHLSPEQVDRVLGVDRGASAPLPGAVEGAAGGSAS
jgi:hypothetical protein